MFNHNNETFTDPFQIAEKFNDMYINIGKSLASKIPKQSRNSLGFFAKQPNIPSFFIQINVSNEPQKGGILPNELEYFLIND